MALGNVVTRELDQIIEQAFEDWTIPGGVVAVVKDGEPIHWGAYGVREVGKSDRVDTGTLFAIGSCTKAFTAAGIALLVDEGQVGWDDHVVRFLPDFELWDPWLTQEVTLRDLMTHRVGNMRVQRLLMKEEVFDPDDMFRRMRFMRPAKPFRTTCHYNNPGYVTAGKVIEAVSGTSWRQFIEERLLAPLGMDDSFASYGAWLDAPERLPLATQHGLPPIESGYVPSSLRWQEPVAPKPWSDLGENAAGSILSNLRDSMAWLQMLLDDGKHEGQPLLSPQAVRELLRPQILIRVEEDEDVGPIFAAMGVNDWLAYGLGWYVCHYHGRRLMVHGGDAVGHSGLFVILPDDRAIVIVLCNTQTMGHALLSLTLTDWLVAGADRRDYHLEGLEIWREMEQDARERVAEMAAERRPDLGPTLSEAAYTGTYHSPIFGEITITTRAYGAGLWYQLGGGDFHSAPLEHWEGDRFLIHYQNYASDPEFITFVIEDGRRVAAIEFEATDYPSDTFVRVG